VVKADFGGVYGVVESRLIVGVQEFFVHFGFSNKVDRVRVFLVFLVGILMATFLVAFGSKCLSLCFAGGLRNAFREFRSGGRRVGSSIVDSRSSRRDSMLADMEVRSGGGHREKKIRALRTLRA
jgi:nanoRNase/pAp phosphatase (c-di-AMP/oligoRNAs hydrolase)